MNQSQDLTTVPAIAKFLPAIERAAEPHPGVYLVGGAVRDLLLGADGVDLDIAVEGDALGFARDLGSILGATVREHERFQTAVVEAGAGTIDVAATRTETYAAPGALPEVSMAGLGEDLARRDFTVNAIACSLRRQDQGTIVDPHGGVADLRAGLIRVLYAKSFRDDPTRMLRAVRYAARLGFQIEPETERLLGTAIGEGRLAGMESARIRDELLDLLSEDQVLSALELLELLRLDLAMLPGLSAGRRARALVAKLEQPDARLAALCLATRGSELAAWLDRIELGAQRRDQVVGAAIDGPPLAAALEQLDDTAPSALNALIAGRPELARQLAAACSDAAARLISSWRADIATVRLDIGGDDLIAAGVPEGPALGEALDHVLELKLDGVVDGRDEQLSAALRLLGREPAGQ